MSKKSTHRRKITREEVQLRETYVEDALSGLVPYTQLLRGFMVEFGTSQRTAEKYVAKVRARWAAETPPKRRAKRDQIERSADLVFREARANGKYASCNAALRLKAALHGLGRPKQETKKTKPIDCTPEDIAALQEEIYGAARDKPRAPESVN